MRASARTGLRPLWQGVTFLLRHPWQTFGLAALTVLLLFLGAILRIRTGVAEDAPAGLVLSMAALLPLELYFTPRFILALDAEILNHPRNPAHAWKSTFEARWFAASAAKGLLYLSVGLGAAILILPGLVLLAAFGWAPWRVLLRGDSLPVAAGESVRLTARFWPRLLLPFGTILAVQFAAIAGTVWLEARLFPVALPPGSRILHAGAWFVDLGGALLNLWTSTTCLAAYHDLEQDAPPVDQDLR